MTIQSVNFGNRLQNYALQETVKSLGYNVESIRRKYKTNPVAALFSTVSTYAKYIVGMRIRYFRIFDRNILFSSCYAYPNGISKEIKDHYDCIIAGSDQIWNPLYPALVGSSDLLSFATTSKRVAYAASFGIEKIPDEKKDEYAKALTDFDFISVREAAGAGIIKALIGKDVPVVLDPVLLLSAEQWKMVEMKPKNKKFNLKEKYAVVYGLGGISNEMNEKIGRLKTEGIQIIDVISKNHGVRPALGPSEFVYLIHHAEIVLTDSFHAMVFSIIFRKRFITFPRPISRTGLDINSRIVSLAIELGFQDYYKEGKIDCSMPIDWDSFQILLNKKKSQSIEYLETALP